jgi:hypothetical protein
MKKIIDLIKTNIWKITSVIFLFLFLSKGCTNTKISNLDKKYTDNTSRIESKLDSLTIAISRVSTSKQVRDEMELTMFNYLIYEDDLDKGKTSLSEIKNKIESND